MGKTHEIHIIVADMSTDEETSKGEANLANNVHIAGEIDVLASSLAGLMKTNESMRVLMASAIDIYLHNPTLEVKEGKKQEKKDIHN